MKKKKWWIFLVTTSGTSVVFLDNTVMPVALPTIQRELLFSPLTLVWIVNAYLLSLTSLLLIGGRLCDLFGRRSVLVTGLILFGLGSLFSALSMTQWWMILGRAVQGAGGALIVPTTSALLIETFPLGERAKAIGINTGISSIFLILGPAVGGLFTEYLSWRGIFYLNIPLVVFGIAMAFFILHPSKKKKESFHFMGALMMLFASVTLIVGLMQGNQWGWSSPLTITLLALSPVFFVLFWWVSTHTEHPLIDFHFFKNRLFTVANIFIFLTQVVIMVTVLWAIYFQNQMHYSAAKTGLIIFIAVFPVFLMAPLGGYIGDRFGPRLPLLLGFSLLTFALFWLSSTIRVGNLALLLPGLLCFGSGIPMILSPTIAMALSQVPAEKLGAAAGITTETRQLASTFGIAVLTTIYYTTLERTESNTSAFWAISFVSAILGLIGLIVALCTVKNGKKIR
ncbi:MAG: Multidrug resistance protein Stp [Chlamydiales bacterium]|nr:Multidrug resistance protein Stp [Chlamydiales bacterium]